ncbi:hypothetical protein HK102_005315 [Quaeritorhiza haematococci]|nr:hypothetical protein HK102_005315 [Quaeritorhiza haematococci]
MAITKDTFRLTWRRFFFYTFWILSHLGIFIFGFIKQKTDPDLKVLNSIGASVWTSRGAGLVLVFDSALLLLPVCRNLIRIVRSSTLNRLVPFDYNVYFHKCTAYAMLFWSLVHVNAHYVNFFQVQRMDLLPVKAWQIHYHTNAGITGHLMLLCMLLMYTTAKIQVRARKYELFWYMHHLYFPFYILLMLHQSGCFVKSFETKQCKPYNTYQWVLPGFLLYLIERVIREYRAQKFTVLTKVVFHPGNTIEIQLEKPDFQYKPGQYLFLNIPEVSFFEWHPYTITSTPEEGFISLHMRVCGDWTRKAAKILGSFQNGITKANQSILPTLRIDGPFGAPAEDVFKYKSAVLIGAGIGVTPMASLLKSIWYRYYRRAPMSLQKVYFFWVNRDKQAFEWFQDLLATIEESVPSSFLEIHVYLTGHMSIDDIHNIVLNDQEEFDPLTELQSRCHYGRPACDKNSTDKVKFELRKEHF